MYKIILDQSAEKELAALPKETLRKVVRAINGLEQEPQPSGVKKLKVSDEN